MTRPNLIAKHTVGSVYRSASAGQTVRRAQTQARWWFRAAIVLAVALVVGSLFPEVYRWHWLFLAGVLVCSYLHATNAGYVRGWQAAFMEQRKPLVRGHRG